MRFVPKAESSSSPSSSSSRDHHRPTHRDPPPRSLTTSLRESSSSSSSAAGSRSSGEDGKLGGGYLNYLPQDEAVASGLGAEDGGLDAAESQRVVDVLNGELSRLLKMKPREFWKEVACNDSLYGFLDSYLQFRNRWYDFPHRGAKEVVAGVIVGEAKLSRRVFMVLYRMSSNKDPGVHSSDCLSAKVHAALLQEKKFLDLPNLFDVCAIYGHENEELTRLLVSNAIRVQPRLVDDISATVSHFLSIADTMNQRCSSSLEGLVSSVGHEYSRFRQLHTDFLEVMDFINDAIVTLDAFVNAYKPGAVYLSHPVETSHGNEELLSVLARLHNSLLPSLRRGLLLSYKKDGAHNSSDSTHTNIALSFKMLSMRIVKLGWKLLDICYLSEFLEDGLVLQNATKMLPANVEDPVIRGDILVQTFREINLEVPFHPQDIQKNGTFLQNVEKNHNILSQISSLRNKGWIYIDDEQFHYLSQIATPPSKAQENEPKVPVSLMIDKVQMDEDTAIMESKISQIKDLFPDYGKGFLMACLEVYNQNPEEVISRILDGTLHNDLSALDTSLEEAPLPKSVSISRNDKGKGVVLESVSHNRSDKGKQVLLESEYLIASLPSKVVVPLGGKNANGSLPLSSSSYGRYMRKTGNLPDDTEILDSKAAKDSIRSAVLEAQYEDEYDDSFDDLGLSVVESGSEQAEYSGYKSSSLPGKSLDSESQSSKSSSSRWNSQKKPQFYVKDGKNYSYKVAGSVSVSNTEEAALVNEAQKEIIHGLGRGGNLPLGAVKKLMESEEEVDEESGAVENTGRGHPSSRGRGGRRGGNNHHRKDRAIRKFFVGLGSS